MNKDAFPNVDAITYRLSDELCKGLEQTFAEIPALWLDYSWPSIGVIDLISFPLRKKTSMSALEKELLYMTTAYLGNVISRVWQLSGIDHKVYFDELKGGVCLRFRTDTGAEAEYLLTNYIHDLLFRMPPEIEVFKGFKRPYTFDANILSSVCLGIALGLAPIGASPSLNQTGESETNEEEKIRKIERAIARLCSEWFTARYPDVMLAQVADLFLKGGILPPLFFNREEGIGDTIDPFIEYLNQIKAPLSMIQQLALVFCACPDEKISFIGVLLGLFSYADYESLPPEIKSALRYHYHLLPIARKNILKYRGVDMTEEYLLGASEKRNLHLYEYEKKIGTLPWLYLTAEDFFMKRDFKIDLFMKAVLSFEYEKAFNELTEIVVSWPGDIGFRIQHMGFEMLRGDYEYAHELAKVLVSEPVVENRPDFYSMWANCLLKLNEPEIALRYFSTAIACATCSQDMKAEILNGIGWCYILLKKEKEAIPYLQEAQLMSQAPLGILLNRAYIYRFDGEAQKARELLLEAAKLLPYDRRVFSNL